MDGREHKDEPGRMASLSFSVVIGLLEPTLLKIKGRRLGRVLLKLIAGIASQFPTLAAQHDFFFLENAVIHQKGPPGFITGSR